MMTLWHNILQSPFEVGYGKGCRSSGSASGPPGKGCHPVVASAGPRDRARSASDGARPQGAAGGGEAVGPLLAAAVISSVNWSEVVQKSIARDVWDESLRADLEALGLSIVPFTQEDAEGAARLWHRTRGRGLSPAPASPSLEAIPAATSVGGWCFSLYALRTVTKCARIFSLCATRQDLPVR